MVESRLGAFCTTQLEAAVEQYRGFIEAYEPALASQQRVPRSARLGATRLVGADDWTSGFPAGCLWLLFEHGQDPAFRVAAERFTEFLAEQRLNTATHDVGFMINNSFGLGHRLTRNPGYRKVIIEAARSLCTRFNPVVEATRSWSFGAWSFPVIIDNMMNLELLWHAGELSGEAQFGDIAVRHALTTLRHHFRSDASSYHLVDFDPITGSVVKKQTHQGVADDSAWARGQAWGLYGFTTAFDKTKNRGFLRQAQAIADFFSGHPSIPDDGVPYFDFAVAFRDDLPKLRDASAAAIAASALLQLQKFVAPEPARRYRAFAEHVLTHLSGPAYRARPGSNGHFLLEHSVGGFPENDEVDAALNYADYYYLEALLLGSRLATAPSL